MPVELLFGRDNWLPGLRLYQGKVVRRKLICVAALPRDQNRCSTSLSSW